MKKTVAAIAAALTAAGAMAAAAVLADPATAAAPTAPTVHPVAVTTPLPPITYSYGQSGPTATVYKRTAALATVTPTAITFDGTTGKLKLSVMANANFSFTAGQFLWEDPDGGDHTAEHAGHTLKFTKNTTRTVTLSFDGVGAGDVIWSPDEAGVAASWVFSTSGAPITAGPASTESPLGYAQKKTTVTVYRAGHVLATVTPKSVTYNRTKGTLTLSVTAKAKFSVKNNQFIWEDPSGGDHAADNPGKTFHLKKNTTRTISISFQDVGKGDIIWAPTEELVTGIWTVPAK